MSTINTQPWTAYTGPYGGSGNAAGFSAVNTDGTAGIKGGAFDGTTANGGHIAGNGVAGFTANGAAAGGAVGYTAPDGSQYYGKGQVGANAQGAAGWGAVSFDNQNAFGDASGSFAANKATGDLDASGSAQWADKSTGQYHTASATADLTKGQGGTITTVKDGVQKTYNIPPRPTA